MTALYHDSPIPSTKICIDCTVEQPLDAFYRGCNRCKPCEQLRRKQRSQERLKEYQNLPPDTTKVCTVCHVEKPLDDFYKQGAGTFGRTGMCKICTLEAAGYTNHLQKVPLPQHGGRVCHKCHKEKSNEDFHKATKTKDQLDLVCKECSLAYHLDYDYRTGRRKRSAPLPRPVSGGKVCTACLTEKPFTDFGKEKGGRGGYNSLCKDCFNAQNRKRYAVRPKERKLAKNQQWYEANKEKHRSLVKRWTTANRLQSNGMFHRYRARKKAATVEEVDYAHILERDSDWCYICNRAILPEHKIDFDHVIPLSRGGAHSEENIKVTHHRCNRRKHNKLLSEMTPYQRRGV